MFTTLAVLALAAPVPKPGPEWVTVKGTVVWPEKEKMPERKALDDSKIGGGDADYLRKGGAAFDDTFLIDDDTRGLKNVIVWLRPDDDDPKATFPAAKVHPDLVKAKPATHTVLNEFCRFDRRMLVARAGDTLKFVNKGTVGIGVDVQHGDTGRANAWLNEPDKSLDVTDLKAGFGFFSDPLHTAWLNGATWPPGRGRFRVFDHPYFALTNERGEFEMKQVPRGKWRIMYQHESGWHKGKDGRLGFPLEVEGNAKGEMTLPPLAFERPKPDK